MSEIKDRQDAASDIDPIAAALADTANDTWAAAAVEGTIGAVEPVEAEAETVATPEAAAAALPATADEATSSAAGTETDDTDVAAVALADAAREEARIDEAIQADLVADGDEAAPAAGTLLDPALATEAMPVELATGAEFVLVDDRASGVTPSEIAASTAEAEPFDSIAAYSDTIVELEEPVDQFDADDDTPLLDSELEDGIASVFAALHAAAMDGATPPVEPLGELEAADGITFRLLGELDRLWHRAA